MDFETISNRYPLILASDSPRRKALLEQIGLPFLSLPSYVEEDETLGDPPTSACLLAQKKAMAVHSRAPNGWTLGADTMVVLGEEILGKPTDYQEACSMLRHLSGKEHRVITGFCLLDPSGHEAHSGAITTIVKVKRLTEEEIKAYLATGEPMGKAGAYAIQGIGAFMIESISGSYTNVVGLPICALVKALITTGALREFPLPP